MGRSWAVVMVAVAAGSGACSGDQGSDDPGIGAAGFQAPVVGTGGVTAAGSGGAAGSAGVSGTSGGVGASGASGSGGAGAGGASGAGAGAGGASGAGAGAGAAGGAGAGAGGATGTGGAGGADAGSTMPGEVVFSPNVQLNDDSGNGRQTEVAIAAGPDGLVLAGWMDERAERVCAFSFSTDGGATWSENVSIPNVSNFVGDPSVAIDGGGTMYAVCQQYGANNIRMMTSTDRGQTWSQIRNVQSAPDKPWVAGGVEEGVVIASWLGNPGGIKRSTDRGVTWETTQSLGRIIHGTAITTSPTGLVHVPYNLDSQNNQLRYLRSKDHGETYEAARDLLEDMGTFCFSCNPRQHPIVGAGADPTGEIVAITWSSRMQGGEGDDDVWLLYSKDGGDTWTDPIRVNDNATRSRQFESWVAVDAQGWVHVAWTDFRNGGQNQTWYARSEDPTQGFEPNLEVTDDSGSGSTDFLGDYKGIAVQDGNVLIVWQDTRNDSGDIYFSRAVGAAAR